MHVVCYIFINVLIFFLIYLTTFFKSLFSIVLMGAKDWLIDWLYYCRRLAYLQREAWKVVVPIQVNTRMKLKEQNGSYSVQLLFLLESLMLVVVFTLNKEGDSLTSCSLFQTDWDRERHWSVIPVYNSCVHLSYQHKESEI